MKNLDQLAVSFNEGEQQSSEPKQMLVLMVWTIFKPFPVSQYPTENLTAVKLYPVVWETIEALELKGIKVVPITSDGHSTNCNFYNLCVEQGLETDVPYKIWNPHRLFLIYLFCDVPHLLNTARNCFSNSMAHTKSRHLMVCAPLM